MVGRRLEIYELRKLLWELQNEQPQDWMDPPGREYTSEGGP